MRTIYVNVDINSTPSQPDQAAGSQNPATAQAPDSPGAQAGSPLNNTEQSNLKAAMDKKNVVVAVTNGGRPDPFVPFITTDEVPVISVAPPKFDIIAPPDDIPGEINPIYDTSNLHYQTRNSLDCPGTQRARRDFRHVQCAVGFDAAE